MNPIAPELPHRRLGRTDRHIGALGLGVSFVASQGQDVVTRGVRHAHDLGIDYFDTAPYYSQGEDEAMLGKALVGIRDGIMLASKVGYTADPQDHRRVEGLMAQLDGSLQRLRTDHLDVLQIHEADLRKWWMDEPVTLEEGMSPTASLVRDDEVYDFADAPVVAFLSRAVAAGKARHVGVTGKDARRLARIVEALDIDAVMVAHQFNPVLRNAASYLFPLAAERDLGVLVGAPLMKGWLARPKRKWREDPPAWMDAPFHRAYFACVDLADEAGMDLSELALRWMLGETRLHALVFGFRDPAEIAANVRAAAMPALPEDLRQRVDAIGIVHPLVFQGRTVL